MTPEVDTSKPTLFERITNSLNSQNIQFRVIEHAAFNGTANNSSVITGTKPEQGAKALVMMVDGINPIMVVIRGIDKADAKTIKRITNSKDVRMATLDEIQNLTQVEVGTLPAMGSLFNIPTYTDQRLLNEEEIAFGTGLHTKTIIMNTSDFKQVVNPIIGDFAKKRFIE